MNHLKHTSNRKSNLSDKFFLVSLHQLRKDSMQHAHSASRWGWETRLRQAEADLNAVRSRRARSASLSSDVEPTSRTPRGGAPHEHSHLPKHKSCDVSRKLSWTQDAKITEVGVPGRRLARRNTSPAQNAESTGQRFVTGDTEIRTEAALKRRQSVGEVPSLKQNSSESFGLKDRSNEAPQEKHKSVWDEQQRLPSVGDRWACQVLMEEV